MRLLLSGLLLVTTGAVLPFLMATRIIEPSFPLAFLSYVVVVRIGTRNRGSGVTREQSLSSAFWASAYPPTPSPGIDPQRGPQYDFAWWLAVFRGAVIFVAVISYYMVGEGMCDALDPRLK